MDERPETAVGPVAEDIRAAISPFLDRPFVLFGHSVGALIAFELTRLLRRAGLPLPRRLVVSGRAAPQVRSERRPLHGLSDVALTEALRLMGGLPALMLAEPRLLRPFLPALRGLRDQRAVPMSAGAASRPPGDGHLRHLRRSGPGVGDAALGGADPWPVRVGHRHRGPLRAVRGSGSRPPVRGQSPAGLLAGARGRSGGRAMSATPPPLVSVLMPTYRQAAFLPRALATLAAQTFTDWELVVVDDGSPDETGEILDAFDWPLVTRLRFVVNRGLGAALNVASVHARGRYIAYLPSDDLWGREHLATAVAVLEADPDVHLVYSGVRWYPRCRVSAAVAEDTATLRPDISPGQEERILEPPASPADCPVSSGNPLALVQVVHRRDDPGAASWTERHEFVSDSLELDRWKDLLRRGRRFQHSGKVTCEWGDHPDQRHKIISGRGAMHADWRTHGYGLSRYKQFYRLPPEQPIDWQPVASGSPLDERARYAGLDTAGSDRPSKGLKILLVGALGFNPERVLALRRAGHRLYGLWMPDAHFWDTAAPVAFGGVEDVPSDGPLAERIAELQPDVIYGLLNWPALPFLHRVFRLRPPGVPFVFHFKESPFTAMQAGYWPALRELILAADGRVFCSEEERDWFEMALGRRLADSRTHVLDGDLPTAAWMTDAWSPRLSDVDGEPHTVCVGRSFTEPVAELARRGVHVHLYTQPYMRFGEAWRTVAEDLGGRVHVHPSILPREWVRQLSQYDAGWSHTFSSRNGGDLAMADWNDLNVPSRLATYALAGLPWLLRDNSGHRVAVQSLAARSDVGLCYRDYDDLVTKLKEECALRARSDAMRRQRAAFTFEHHVAELVDFMRTV